jgi:hypothetical protein
MAMHEAIELPARSKRTKVLMSCVLVTLEGAQSVKLHDISRSGAHISGSSPVRRDGDVLFKRGSLLAAARVVWVTGDEAGLRFYRELSADEIEGTLPTSLLRTSS